MRAAAPLRTLRPASSIVLMACAMLSSARGLGMRAASRSLGFVSTYQQPGAKLVGGISCWRRSAAVAGVSLVRPSSDWKAKLAAAAAEAASAFQEVPFGQSDSEDAPPVGRYSRIMSQGEVSREYKDLTQLSEADIGSKVWIRARVQNVRAKGNTCFLVLRQGPYSTVQACYFKDKANPEASKAVLKFLGSLSTESVVDMQGELKSASVKSCSVSSMELLISRAYVVAAAEPILPFQLEDAARPEAEVEASQSTDRPFPRIGQELRLDNRWLDLRVPANNCIMRIQSGVCQLFRESLYSQGFMEIHSPKLIGGESEGGAGVFKTDYFGRTACLAQSPQLYKQMAISADMERVFEVGPVFRAENSNTRRHLCEFTGLDLEMAISQHYNEALRVVHAMFKHIFTGLETRYAKDLAVIRQQYQSEPVLFTDEPCIVHWPEAMAMLREAGVEANDFEDLNGAQELKLGELVRSKYRTDFFILDRYPSVVRPFYTMPCPDDPRFSNSYDMFLRGQEICSGAQRVHDPQLLVEMVEAKGIPLDPLLPYINSFRHAASPHAGAGIGLERVVFLYLGLDNVRKASMFPRDPNRCEP